MNNAQGRFTQLKARVAARNAQASINIPPSSINIPIPHAINQPAPLDIQVILHKVYDDGDIVTRYVATCEDRLWPQVLRDAISEGTIDEPGLYIGSWMDNGSRTVTLDYIFTVEADEQAPDGLKFFQGIKPSAPVNVTRWPPKQQ